MSSNTADLIVRVITDTTKAKGLDETAQKGGKFASGLATASKVATGALIGVAGAAIGAAKAAAEDAAGQAKLAAAMEKNAGASKSQIAATEDWISSMSMATGVADDELRPALATLVRTTGDVEKSQNALKVAMDVSAATGKPLTAVTNALAKGFGGSATSIGKLVPGLDQAALKSADMTKIMAELADKTGGAASVAANTAEGKMKRFSLSLQETQEAAGAALLPALMKLTTVLVVIGNWAQQHGTLFTIIAAGVAALSIAVIALNAALKIYNLTTAITAIVTESAWLAALGPILLVVAAVAAVVVIIVILWKKSQTFRKIVLATWDAIKTAARVAAQVIKAVFQVAFAALSIYIRVYVTIFRAAFNVIRTIVRAVVDALKAAWRAVWPILSAGVRGFVAVFRSVIGGVRDAAASAARGVSSAWQAVWGALERGAAAAGRVLSTPFNVVKGAIDAVIRAVENLISALSRIHVPKISLPHIPGLRSVAAPAMAPSAFGAGGGGVAAFAAPSPFAVGSRAAVTPGGNVYQFHISGLVTDPEGTARAIGNILDNHDRRIGRRAS